MKNFPYRIERNSPVIMLLSVVFALCSFLLWGIWFASERKIFLLTLLLACLYLAIGFIKINAKSERAAVIINIAWGLLSIAVVIGATLPVEPTFFQPLKLLLNYLCAFFFVEILFLITANWKVSINISLCILMLLIFINALVLCFRGKELNIMDIFSIKTALSVAGNYTFTMTRRFLLSCFCFGVAVLSQFAIPSMPKAAPKKGILRLCTLCAIIITAVVISCGSRDFPLYLWLNEGSQKNGFMLNSYISIRESSVDVPEGYSEAAVDSVAEQYHVKSDPAFQDNKPNIIIIMDESFADFGIYNNPLSTNIPVTPYIDSLSENTVKGYALTSIFAGGTANAEYELLTGHSMAFLPQGSIPYQQFINDEVFSLAHLLNSYGYTSIATHPYEATGWARNVIYPLFGFDQFTAMDDYPNEELIREYISDREMFSHILDCLNNKGDAPLFLMGITMQNHGGYTYDGSDFENTITLEGYNAPYPQAEQYFSLLHETDKAVEYLLTALAEYDENTLVLFFGDHFPAVPEGLYEELNGSPIDTLEEQMLIHTVPYFIWANYDIPTDTVDRSSLGYLPISLLEYAGIELPAYYRVLQDIQEVIPAINAYGYYSLEKGCYQTVEEASGKEAQYLEMYEILQYNNVFDRKNRNNALFSRYIN